MLFSSKFWNVVLAVLGLIAVTYVAVVVNAFLHGGRVVNVDVLTPEYVMLHVNDHYWDNERPNVLVVDLTITNNWTADIPVICEVRDAKGQGHFSGAFANIPTGETFIYSGVKKGETRRAKLEFLVPNVNQPLTLQCGKNLIAQIQ